MMLAAVAAVALSQSPTMFPSTTTSSNESPRNMMAEVRVGSYYPWVDRPLNCVPAQCPYRATFDSGSMLLVELELERQLFQAMGSAAVGFSLGYTEKFGHALAGGVPTSEATGLRLIPMKALGVYRFDWAALKYRVPLVPYVKLGLEFVYWWSTKGTSTETAGGLVGNGFTFGYMFAPGLAFMLDVLDPRLARDFDSGMGVNHTYLFAEYNIAEVNNFGAKNSNGDGLGLDFSSRFFMFGLAFEF